MNLKKGAVLGTLYKIYIYTIQDKRLFNTSAVIRETAEQGKEIE